MKSSVLCGKVAVKKASVISEKSALASGERGSVAIVSAFLMVFMAALFLAVMTHAQYVKAYTTTREAATNMARAGAQEIDQEVFFLEQKRVIDQEKARVAVFRFAERYPELEVVSIEMQDELVRVTVSERVEAITGRPKTIVSTGSATPLEVD